MASFSLDSSVEHESINPMVSSSVSVEASTSNDEHEGDECGAAQGAGNESDLEDEFLFDPFDINSDGRIIKTASRCSASSWRHPEPGYDVAITVHRFSELVGKKGMGDPQEKADDDGVKVRAREVEPNLQLRFKLRGGDKGKTFSQAISDEANAAGVELHGLLHDGIETMGKNECATFVVKTDDGHGDDGAQPRLLEYELSLDDWIEEVDVSEGHDRSLVKRILREGDGSTKPVDVGRVFIRCRVSRIRETTAHDPEEPNEEVMFDNMQDQDDAKDGEDDGGLRGPTEFVLDDCPFGFGVMSLVKSMSVGELCQALLDPRHVPVPKADDGEFCHTVTLELVDVEELPPVWGSEEIRLKMSTRFKLEGNEKFAAGDYNRALRRYAEAIRYADGVSEGDIESDEDDQDSENGYSDSYTERDSIGRDEAAASPQGVETRKNAFANLQAAILCNQTACYLKIGDGPLAMEAADRASEIMSTVDSAAGRKAAYRRACALEAVGEWDESRAVFKRVMAVDPKNVQCRQGLARLASAEKAYRTRLKTAFGGCLVSGKLDGFASDNRPAPTDDERQPTPRMTDFAADGAEAGPWSNGSSDTSESDTESGGGYYSDSEVSSVSGEKEMEEATKIRGGESGVEEEKDYQHEKALCLDRELLGNGESPLGDSVEPLSLDKTSSDSTAEESAITIESTAEEDNKGHIPKGATAAAAVAAAPASEPPVGKRSGKAS